MKRLTRLFVATAFGSTALLAHASISYLSVDELGLTSLSESEMSSLRGGFVSISDNIINIGLSISTAINGETVYSTHIADFTINNGILTSRDGRDTYDYGDPVKIISHGYNNIVKGKPGSDVMGVFVQNSKDNTVINNQTVLDIEADIKSFNQQTLFKTRLENSILYNGY
ncbi:MULTISPECIES: hypothetical protein [Photobacterium]|uniref:Uncharacterized protein n=1 Tax=Photobacterium ganghwense TaxID=320778 RepID=A0A0J1HFN7_9GAMM|nr:MULTISPECIES: hypothetical protein [Photobacterium]KLV10414.1 hypothetical protein ABT57_07650 [Photobacterium ganghwense]MBV1841412.1 hypothetical protein [Photobacterium ganghwense]PSU09690.1 hypothetical protein C9I92_09240 [Photobacterium ganghwense]QSV16936.1 hypothetical protein FH974_18450 [Photobacterium ganghwense]